MARITLSKSAFFHNLALLSEKLGSKEKLAIVLKDNAYGHGLMPMAELSHAYGIRRAVVRTFAEAEAIKTLFDYILILNPRAPYINDPRFALTINDLAQLHEIPPKSRIELKIDTGMHRNGLRADNLPEIFSLIDKKSLRLNSVMTHFRSTQQRTLLADEKVGKCQKRGIRSLQTLHDDASPLPLRKQCCGSASEPL